MVPVSTACPPHFDEFFPLPELMCMRIAGTYATVPNGAPPRCSSVRLELFSCCVCHVLVVMKANCGRCQLRGRFDGPALLAAVKTSIQVCTFIAVCLVHGRALASAVSSLRFLDRCCEVRIYVIEHIDTTRSHTSIEPLLFWIGTVFNLCRFQCSRLITA